MNDRQLGAVSVLKTLPAYSGWEDGEILDNITDVLSSGDSTRISGLTNAVSGIDNFYGWQPEEITNNLNEVFAQQPSIFEKGKELAGKAVGAAGELAQKGVEAAKDIFTPEEPVPEKDYSIEAIQQSLNLEPAPASTTGVSTAIEAPPAPTVGQQAAIGPQQEKPLTAPPTEPMVATQEAVAGTTAIPTEPEELKEAKLWAAAEAESPLVAGLKEAGLALTFSKSEVSPYRALEHPAAATTGQIAGTLAPMVIGGTGVAKALGSVPKLAAIANSGKTGKVAFDAIARMTTVAMNDLVRNNEELFSEDEDTRNRARKNMAINLAAAGVSPTPEQFLPRGLIQPVAQGATDLIVETVGQAVAGDNAFSKENLANTIASTLMGTAFGLADIKGVDAKTKGEINKLKTTVKESPATPPELAPIETLISPERLKAINNMVRTELEKVQTPAKSNVIKAEKPEFEVVTGEQVPSGIEAIRNIRKPPTETDLKLTVPDEGVGGYIKEYEQPSKPQQATATTEPTTAGEQRSVLLQDDAAQRPKDTQGGTDAGGKLEEPEWLTTDLGEYIEKQAKVETPESIDGLPFTDVPQKINSDMRGIDAMYNRIENDKLELDRQKKLYSIIKRDLHGTLDAKSFAQASDQNFVLENSRFFTKSGGVDMDRARMDFISKNRAELQELGITESDIDTPSDFANFLINAGNGSTIRQLKQDIRDGEAELYKAIAEIESGELTGKLLKPSQWKQQDLFGEERSVADIEVDQQKKLQRQEIKQLTEETKGGEADLKNLPMFEDQEIEGSQQTLFSGGKNVPEVQGKAETEAEVEENILPFRSEEEVRLPERKRGILSEVGAVSSGGERKIDFANDRAMKVEKIFDEQDDAVRRHYYKPLKEKMRDAVDFLGEKFIDRVYYAKRLLGNTPEGQDVIGKVNASKGSSAEAKIQYEDAEKIITKNLPYNLEKYLSRYLEAKRISEIETVKGEGQVRHTGGMTKDDADAYIATLESKLSTEELAALKVTSDRYWSEMNNQLTQLRDNGLITEESYKTLSEQGKNYSPRKFLQHIDPETTITTPQGKRISVRESGIKSLGAGSEQAMVNNWRVLLSDVIARTQTRIYKNKASKALGDFVVKYSKNEFGGKIDTSPDEKLPVGMERIYFMENGESKAVLVPQKFADSWNQNDAAVNQGLAQFLNIASGSALVRPLATGALAPEFALSNVPRDMALQWLSTSEYSRVAPLALIQNFNNFRKVFKDAWTGEGRYKDYVKQGGGMEFLNEQGTFLVKDPTKTMTPSIERNKQIVKAFTKLQEFSERLTRLALREQALKNGKTPEEATRIAREYLDFAQGGSWTKAINNAIPYLNASTQGTRSVVRGARQDPVGFSLKAAQLMMLGAAATYTANQFRKKEWSRISDREKVNRWNFPLGMGYKNQTGEDVYTYFSIPKDQSSRIFATIGETMAERGMGVIDGETAWRRMSMAFDDLSPVDFIGLLPPSLSAIIGYATNKNFWKRSDIWKGRKVSPFMEIYEGKTPEAYKDVAAALNGVGIKLSPERLNQSLQQVMPKTPTTALMAGAYDSIKNGLDDNDKMKLNKTTLEHISKMPGMRKFLRSTYPSKTDSEQMFDKMIEYGVSSTDESGNKKTEQMLKNEIEKKEMKVNDIRQQHDNEARVVSEMLISGENDAEKLRDVLIQKAAKELGGKEAKRIARRITDRIKKNKTKNVYLEKIYER